MEKVKVMIELEIFKSQQILLRNGDSTGLDLSINGIEEALCQ